MGRIDAESETLIPTHGGRFDVAHSLRGEAFDASEDGTGRGTPLVPIGLSWQKSAISITLDKSTTPAVAYPIDTQNMTEGHASGGIGFGAEQDPSFTLSKGHSHAVAFGVGEAPDVGHCLRSGASKADKHESTTYIQSSMQVRRLTPTECERLQGFPDGYTQVPYRNKPAADGPRYKALGNSMAVPVMRWIGARIVKFT